MALMPGLSPRHITHWLCWAALLTLQLMLSACGGGSQATALGGVGEDGTGAPAHAASIGVITGMDATTITVNDITFDRSSATIADAMSGPLTDADLKPGMWVQVDGRTDADGQSPVAETIAVVPTLRGEVTAVDGGMASVTVLDNTVQIDANTLIDGSTGQSLQVGDTVEVHGLLQATAGTVTATRIDKLASMPTGTTPYELRGKVTQLDTASQTMKVGARLVSYVGASITLPKALTNGMVVRVAAAQPPVAGQPWAIQRILPGQDLPANMAFVYLEGVVDQWQSGPVFALDGLPVSASTANGKANITQDGQRVAVIGTLKDGTLVAKSVALVTPGAPVTFVLYGDITNYQSAASFKVRYVQVDASAATFTVGNATQLADGVKVRVVGSVSGRQIQASKVKIISP
jgi:Domain of unknown function (DUF5666)